MTTEPETRVILGVDAAIPENMTTEEAAEFWDTHTPSRERIQAAQADPETQELLSQLRGNQPRPSPRQPRQPRSTFVTSLRLDTDTEQRLKHVAEIKKIPYQTLLKQFVGERLYEEEKRLGVI